MRIYALQLNNDIVGIDKRKGYIEKLINSLEKPDLVVLPELAYCGYSADTEIWKLADDNGKEVSEWAVKLANRYSTMIGIGFLDKREDDYYNSYMIVGPEGVYGVVDKCEGEAYVFKRGDFNHIINTPVGKIAVAICYDSRRKHFYDSIKNEEIYLILFPHGVPADPNKTDDEMKENDLRMTAYAECFDVPVIYANSVGKMAPMLGKTGEMMREANFRLNGLSKIYLFNEAFPEKEGVAFAELNIEPHTAVKKIRFYGNDQLSGNWLFRTLILNKDIKDGIKFYEENKKTVPTKDSTQSE